MLSPEILLTIIPSIKSTQLVCGTTATIYFGSLGKVPVIFQFKIWLKNHLEKVRLIIIQ